MGFFIDQWENCVIFGKYVVGKKILNMFCYLGGFSFFVLKNGVIDVYFLDVFKKVIVLIDVNVELNNFVEKYQLIVVDVMQFIWEIGEEYDFIVLDLFVFVKYCDKCY